MGQQQQNCRNRYWEDDLHVGFLVGDEVQRRDGTVLRRIVDGVVYHVMGYRIGYLTRI
jgi:hypothetical protein